MFIKEDLKVLPIVGIVGSMGAGKTELSHWLIEQGFAVIDCDKYGRMVRKHPEVIKSLMEYFGSTEPQIIRQAIEDPLKMAILQEVVTRRVFTLVIQETKRLVKAGQKVVFWDAGILIELDIFLKIPGVILVTAEEPLRLMRILNRDHLSLEQVRPLLNYQLSEEEKLIKIKEHPHYLVLDNNHSAEQYYRQFGQVIPFLRSLPFWDDLSI